jgi:5-hydroxyisourate hydrolase-like protein (transthyretin family)
MDYNIYKVEENYITQIVNMKRDQDGKFNINKVDNFDITKGDVKTRTITDSYLGGLIKINREEKYRVLEITMKTTVYKDNKPMGAENVKKYTREELVN